MDIRMDVLMNLVSSVDGRINRFWWMGVRIDGWMCR